MNALHGILRLATVVGICASIFSSQPCHAQPLGFMDVACAAFKFSRPDGVPTFSDLGQMSATTPLVRWDSPISQNFAGEVLTADPANPSGMTIETELDGLPVRLTSYLSILVMKPNRWHNFRWGMCQFTSGLTLEGQRPDGTFFGTSWSTADVGAQRQVRDYIVCDDLSVRDRGSFGQGTVYGTLPYGEETVLYGCTYRLRRII